MTDLILTTFDWVPEFPRGYVRDIRIRWALEEAGMQYSIESVPFRARDSEHFAHQPFGQEQPPCFVDAKVMSDKDLEDKIGFGEVLGGTQRSASALLS